MRGVNFILISPNEQCGGGEGGGEGGGIALLDFFYFHFSPVQQTTSGIGHRVK